MDDGPPVPDDRCARCGEGFEELDDCDEGEIGAILTRLMLGRFTCPECGASTHGGCGGASSRAAPGHYRVECAACSASFEGPTPFRVRPFQL